MVFVCSFELLIGNTQILITIKDLVSNDVQLLPLIVNHVGCFKGQLINVDQFLLSSPHHIIFLMNQLSLHLIVKIIYFDHLLILTDVTFICLQICILTNLGHLRFLLYHLHGYSGRFFLFWRFVLFRDHGHIFSGLLNTFRDLITPIFLNSKLLLYCSNFPSGIRIKITLLHFFDQFIDFIIEMRHVFLIYLKFMKKREFTCDSDIFIKIVIRTFNLANGYDSLVVHLGEFPFCQH